MDELVDYKMNSTETNSIYSINKYELTECNRLEKIIEHAKTNMLDIKGLRFKGCYEAHIDTHSLEFNTCEFAESICLNAKFNRVTFVDVVFESCDFSNTDFSECNFIRVKLKNCKIPCIFSMWNVSSC